MSVSNQPAARFLNLPFNRAVTLSAAFAVLTGSIATVVPMCFRAWGWFSEEFALTLILSGVATAVPSFVVLCIASRCTKCSYKLFWHAVSKGEHSEGLTWFMFAEACPNCGGTRKPAGKGLQGSA
jgi:hypothetical protein